MSETAPKMRETCGWKVTYKQKHNANITFYCALYCIPIFSWVGIKPGLWTLDWTMDWTMDWFLDWVLDFTTHAHHGNKLCLTIWRHLSCLSLSSSICQGCRSILRCADGSVPAPSIDLCVARVECRSFWDATGILRTCTSEGATCPLSSWPFCCF